MTLPAKGNVVFDFRASIYSLRASGKFPSLLLVSKELPNFWSTVFVVLWLAWNSWAPESWRFDSASLGFTALTLMLSLQASYASPLILLAQNRQDDRDRVSAEQDRRRAEKNHAEIEYLTREIASLRLSMSEVATRDFVRGELRDLLDELKDEDDQKQRRETEE